MREMWEQVGLTIADLQRVKGIRVTLITEGPKSWKCEIRHMAVVYIGGTSSDPLTAIYGAREWMLVKLGKTLAELAKT